MANIRFIHLLSAILLSYAIIGCSTERLPDPAEPKASTMNDTYSIDAYDALLKTYVDEKGQVNYKDLQSNRADLDAYIASLGAISTDTYSAWSENEKMALWINAYNAITLKAIIDHYPIEKGGLINGVLYPENSIRQIDGVWKKHTTLVAGRTITLDSIEHDVLRVEFSEPRIHVAIVCASVSCPPLRNEAFVPDRLDAQLTDQSRRFFADPVSFQIDRDKNKVYLSEILDWFDSDFVGHYNKQNTITGHSTKHGAILDYARTYASESDAQFLATETYKVDFLDYDWSLNEQP